ncbi:MAG TPA: hypothetical protein VD994_13285, partial [Prosthecobacter sp.]|nr:hypothetical protein [Prosthecobacter sp.]
VNIGINSPTGADIFVLRLDQKVDPCPFAAEPPDELSPRFSSDGKWVAYVSNESGAVQIYIKAFPPSGEKIQVSTEGGQLPRWSHDGTRIFFKHRRKMMVAELEPAILTGRARPSLLFESPWEFDEFEVLGDTGLFLMSIEDPAEASPPIHLIFNWQAALGG